MVNSQQILERQNYLVGWNSELPQQERIKFAIDSRPMFWTQAKRLLSAAKELQGLAEITNDYETRTKAQEDVNYLIKEYRKLKGY